MGSLFSVREGTGDDRPTIEQWAMFRLTHDPSLVGCLDGVIVAYLLYWSGFASRDVLHIQYLEVHPDYQGRGYGRALVQHLQQQCSAVSLLTAEWVQWESVGFWRKMGFEPDGEEEWTLGVDEHAGNFEWSRIVGHNAERS